MDTLEVVCEIVAEVTQNPTTGINERSTASNVDGWDGGAQVSIIASVEMEFGASFSEQEMKSLNSVRKIAQALAAQKIAA